MANILTNTPTGIKSQTEPLRQLQNMLGLSLILGRVSHLDTIQNTSQSVNDIKNHMVYARAVKFNEINRVAVVQPGETKYVLPTTRPSCYRGDGTSAVSQQSGKAYALDGAGYMHVILGNSNLNWCQNRYDGESFRKELPTHKGNGIQYTSDGWAYVTVGKMFDGINPIIGNYFPVVNYMDQYNELMGLNRKNEKAQSTRICGSANEQTTGTCCLYYKENYYDSVAGVTWSAGDYYKCTCAKCYHCLEIARSLDMDYVFTKFVGSGPTGGTGERCQDCDLDNYPNNCGPCPCVVETNDEIQTILNNPLLPPKGMAKENARIAKSCKGLEGTALMHCNLDGVDYTKREISRLYWGKKKEITLEGLQDDTTGYDKTVYSLVTEVMNNTEYVVGINVISIGQYTAKPSFSEDALKRIVPGLKKSNFDIRMLPDWSKLSELEELVGGTRIQIMAEISIPDIARKTNIDTFNIYALGVPKTVKNEPLFANTADTTSSSGLMYRNKNVTISDGLYASLTEAQTAVGKEQGQEIKNTTDNNISVTANAKALNTNTKDLEIFSNNKNNPTEDSFSYSFGGKIWTADISAWSKPTSASTGELLDAQKTDILHVNGFSLNIPDAKKQADVSGWINATFTMSLTI
jgi:hypothetical protein